MLWLLRLCLILTIALAGCGTAGNVTANSPPPGPPVAQTFPGSLRSAAPVTGLGAFSVDLRAGWNAVGLKGARLTAVSPNASLPGLAWFDGSTYQVRSLSLSDLNEGEAGRRGLWIFATQATRLEYAGEHDSRGPTLALRAGWNLVSLGQDQAVPGASLRASRQGQSVPLESVLLNVATRIEADNRYSSVPLGPGGSLDPGFAYWIFAATDVTLSWERSEPVPSPAASPSPPIPPDSTAPARK